MKQAESDKRGESRDNGAKKGKGLDKEHVWRSHSHDNSVETVEGGVGWAEEGKGEKWDYYNRKTIKND